MTHKKTTKALPPVGSIIRLKANAHRYRGGEARVLRHEHRDERAPRDGMIVVFEGREIFVVSGEAE